MLLTICTCSRKRYLLIVASLEDFVSKVEKLLGPGYSCYVLEEDGTEVVKEMLEAILEAREKIGVLMILRNGENWSRAVADECPRQTAGLPNPNGQTQPSLTTSDSTSNDESPASPQRGTAAKKLFLDVRTVLGKNPKGQKVLAEYDQHQTLSSEARQTLVKVVVAQLVHDCGPYPTKEDKVQLASAIVSVLPGSKDASAITGYHFVDVRQEHFFSESNGQTGYIQDRLKRVRRSLAPENQQRPRKKSSHEDSQSAHTDSRGLPHGEESEQQLSDAEIDKLRMDCVYANPATDKAVILSAMCKTAAARQQWNLQRWPILLPITYWILFLSGCYVVEL